MPLSLNISLSLSKCRKNVLKYVNICIPAHSKIGFIGTTGSGKTTTVDLILGLIDPSDGHLKVDGQSINAANRRQWQRNIGYVPQHIYLADDSVAANIAFGVKPEDIDQQAVELAAGIANMHDFVCNELPQGYATTVGERGVRSLADNANELASPARFIINLNYWFWMRLLVPWTIAPN